MVVNAATEAENKPVCSIPFDISVARELTYSTHKKKNPLSILLPEFSLLVVFVLCDLRIHGKERLRAIIKLL